MSLYLVQLACCGGPGQDCNDCIVFVFVGGMLVIMSSLVACDLTWNQAVFSSLAAGQLCYKSVW